ncbi:MAG: hypothetical protein HYR91_08155 [Flavobacteriia bacterium]|nr:hypothetical protein [Flavobacteriia bacterium]
MDTNEFQLVEKETITECHFQEEEILKEETDRKTRQFELDRAIALGNLEHFKVKIFFADDKGKKVVNTTIWAITDSSILLKQNVLIPINRIIKLEI